MSLYHSSVLTDKIVEIFNPSPGKVYIDATLGGGGHLLSLYKKNATVYGLDIDKDAFSETQKNLINSGIKNDNTNSNLEFDSKNVKLVYENFKNIYSVWEKLIKEKVDGVLFDLGVSSNQLDKKNKGFTYRDANAAFDLRLDSNLKVNASDLINNLTEKELYELIATYGEEELARPIAGSIIRARQVRKIEFTGQVVGLIEQMVSGEKKFKVLSRVFQAFRIAVNHELEALRIGLDDSVKITKKGGIIIVISYHSIEDRITKLRFNKSDVTKIFKKPITADSSEVSTNRRSRSAKLRAVYIN